jgi:hypothetical protein
MRRVSLGVIALLASTSIAFACGIERWPVKVGTDKDASKVSTTAEDSTIAKLIEIHAPQHPNARKASRFTTELKTFRVEGKLTVIKGEKDEDYHLVIVDPSDSDATMIVESPAPGCAEKSRFLQQIKDVRAAIDKKLGKIKSKKRPNIDVTVTGVAFFDPIHGQEGVAANGIELHPILDIAFH